MSDQDARAEDQKKSCDHFKKHGSARLIKINQYDPSKKAVAAAQSKKFDSDVLIVQLLMFPGNV